MFSSNLAHLSAVSIWFSVIFYVGAYFSNYDSWILFLALTFQLSQAASEIFGQGLINFETSNSAYGIYTLSGIFNVCLSWGIVSTSQLKFLALLSSLIALAFLVGKFLSTYIVVPSAKAFKFGYSFTLKALVLFSLGMISWSGHILHVSIPTVKLVSYSVSPDLIFSPSQLLFSPIDLRTPPDDYFLFSLYLAAMHHLFGGLACSAIFVCLLHFKNSINISMLSWHYLIASNLFLYSAASFLVANTLNIFPVYPFLSTDLLTLYLLFTHHVWIAMFLAIGSFAHLIIGYLQSLKGKSLRRFIYSLVHHRKLLISHLSWVCIFLGLHSFGLLIHNDTMEALGRIDDTFSDYSIQLKPLFYDLSLVESSYCLPSSDLNNISLVSHSLSGTSEFIVAHVNAFNAHVSLLITLKGILFARSSRFVADKISLGFRYPCDGPGKGGSCQISPWDHIFLTLFWFYNLFSTFIFDFFWHSQSDLWLNLKEGYFIHPCAGNFSANSSTVNGWLRDFLWSQVSQVIQGYATINYLYSLLFLVSHFL